MSYWLDVGGQGLKLAWISKKKTNVLFSGNSGQDQDHDPDQDQDQDQNPDQDQDQDKDQNQYPCFWDKPQTLGLHGLTRHVDCSGANAKCAWEATPWPHSWRRAWRWGLSAREKPHELITPTSDLKLLASNDPHPPKKPKMLKPLVLLYLCSKQWGLDVFYNTLTSRTLINCG